MRIQYKLCLFLTLTFNEFHENACENCYVPFELKYIILPHHEGIK